MRLILENGERWENPGRSDIDNALKSLGNSGNSFAILERSENEFMQIAGDAEGGFIIEYQSGSTDKHYQSEDHQIALEPAVETLASYAAKDRRWRSNHTWTKLDLATPGVFGSNLSLILLIAGALILIAAFRFEQQLENLLGVPLEGKLAYIVTFALALMLPSMATNVKAWKTLKLNDKLRAVFVSLMFLVALIMSIMTYLGKMSF